MRKQFLILLCSGGSLFSVSNINYPVQLTQSLSITSDNVSDTLVFSQPISGIGFGITFEGIGTLTFSGANLYSGGTTINGGTLLMGAAGVMPSGGAVSVSGGVFDLNNFNQSVGDFSGTGGDTALGGATLTITQTADQTYAGTFSETGMIDKNGASRLSLTGTSNLFAGTLNVNAGELKLNGTLGSGGMGDVTVFPGAIFSGNATVGGTLTNSGTLTPGNSIGIFNVNQLILNPNSILQPEINDALQSDLIVAASGGSVIDGTLDVVFLPGVYVTGLTYTIFNGPPSGFTGHFTTVTDNTAQFSIGVTYGVAQGDILLTILTPNGFVFFNLPLTGNAAVVAENIGQLDALGTLATDPDLLAAVTSLIGQDFTTIEDALLKLDPTPYTSIGASRAMISPMLASFYAGKPKMDCCPSRCECKEGQWSVWANPLGVYLDQKSQHKENGFSTTVGGVAIGAETCLTPVWRIGFGFIYDNIHIDWKHRRGHSSSDNFYGSIAAQRQGESTYLACALLGGCDALSNERKIQFTTIDEKARSSYVAPELIGQLSGAVFSQEDDQRVNLYANITSDTFIQPSFREHDAGGLGLRVKQQTSSVLVSEMGFLWQMRNEFSNGCWGPDVWVAYINEAFLTNGKLRSCFVNQTIPFTTVGFHKMQNFCELGLTLSGSWKDSWVISGTYSPQIGSSLIVHRADARCVWKF